MGVISIEGLGQVKIEGNKPTLEEQRAILSQLKLLETQPVNGKEASFFGEVFPQIGGGIRDAAQSVLDLVANRPAAYFARKFSSDDAIGRPFKPLELPTVAPAETAGGGMVRVLSQFLVPYLGALKVVGVGGTVLNTLARAEGAAILTEQAVFDPFDQKLADLIQQVPSLQNPVTEFLQADEDDSEAEARFKLALESAGLGVIVPSFIGALKGLTKFKKGKIDAAMVEVDKAQGNFVAIDEAPLPTEVLRIKTSVKIPEIDKAPSLKEMLETDFEVGDIPAALRNVDADEDIKSILVATSKIFAKRMDEAKRTVIPDAQLKELANEVGLTVEELVSRSPGYAGNAEYIMAARQLMVDSATDLRNAGAKASKTGLDADLLDVKSALNRHVAIQEHVIGLAAEAGRSLRQFRLMAGINVDELIITAGGKRNLHKISTLLSELDPKNLKGFNSASKVMNDPTLSDKVLEAWINGLLSGPQTHAVNALSNTLTSIWSIPEHYMAAGIGAVRKTPGRETFGEVNARVVGWIQGAKDGFSLAKKTFITEDPSDFFSKLEGRRQKSIKGVKGKIIRIPGRALMASDEFFKSIGYRMELNAQAYRSAAKAGLNPRSREFAEHMQSVIDKPPENIRLKAIDNARYLTFTKPIEGVSKHLMRAAADAPAIRIIAPFIRTPVNIVRFASERTPFGLIMRETRGTTGAARDRQMAKMGLGAMAGASISMLAAEGKITGSGPTDPSARAWRRMTGEQPYSFAFDDGKGGKTYQAYSRVEPLGILFGLSSDFSNISGLIESGERDKIAAMIAASITQNLTDKTFFRGISGFIEAANDPDRYFQTYMNNLAGTIVPTGLAQIARVIDPVWRETRTALDKVMSRLPGYSKDLFPVLDFWGNPIAFTGGLGPDILSPLYTSYSKNDPVNNEMVRLGYTPGKPQKKINNKEIPQDLYWKFVKQAGEPAYKELRELVASSRWKNLDKLPLEQEGMMREIIGRHRDWARRLLRIDLAGGNRADIFLSPRDKALVKQYKIGLERMKQERLKR